MTMRTTAELDIASRITEHKLSGEPALRYFVLAPRLAPPTNLVVSVHGVSRNVAEHLTAFAAAAERTRSLLVAPLFEEVAFRGYQRLGWADARARADQAALAVVDEVLAARTGVAPQPSWFGFSGGGQFVHRLAMAHPGRVGCYAVAAAGWYTLPDPTRAWPRGTDARAHDIDLDEDAFLRLRALVLVGSEDRERDAALRRSRWLDRHQGPTRIDRAATFVDAVRARARARGIRSRIALARIAGATHSFASAAERGLVDRVFEFFFSLDPAPAKPDTEARS